MISDWFDKDTGRVRLIIVACILMISMVGMFFFFRSSSVTKNLSYSLYDYFLEQKAKTTTANDVVMIVIDDNSIRALEKIWPWPRAYHAGLITELTRMGAKIIAYDILFTESSSSDVILAKAIDKHGAVILPKPLFFSSDGLVPFEDIAHFGHVEVNIDSDGVVRSVDPYLDGMRSFSFAVLNVLADLDPTKITANEMYKDHLDAPIRYIYSSNRSYPTYSFSDVLMGRIDPAEFKDKIVFVGVSATGIGERLRGSSLKNSTFKTGVEIQASIFEALRDEAITEYAGNIFDFIVTGVSIVFITSVAVLASPLVAIGISLLYIALLTASAFLLFYFQNYWYSPIAISVSMICVVFLYTLARIHVSLKEANRTLNLNVADRTKKLVVANLRLAQEMGEKEKIWANLKDSEEQLKKLLDGLQIGIVSTDEEGRLVTANSTALNFFNLRNVDSADKLDAYFKYDLAHGGATINTRDIYQSLVSHRDSSQLECVLMTSNPRYNGIPIALLFSRLSSSEQHTNFACIIRDISDQKRSEFITQEFVATVSHELRTPITSIKGSLGLMSSGIAGDIPVKAQKLLELASRNSDRLLSLVNDILDIQKIQLGTLDFHLKTIDIVAVVRQSIEVNELYAQNLGIKLVGELPAYPIYVMGDSDRLIQVMSNLLSNAAKFSKSDSSVYARVILSGKKVCIEVEDHGVGIPESFKEKVFMKFAQADDAKHRSKGTGLGLSIAKAFIERMGGSIHYVSTENVGTKFYFYLPLASIKEVTDYISDQKAKKDMFL